MKLQFVVVVLCGWAVLGCDGSRREPTIAESVLNDPELAPTPERFVTDAAPCPPTTAANVPVLPLPWHRRIETYFPPGTAPTDLALDYQVAPLARVERMRVTFDFDARAQPEPIELAVECPAMLGTSTWLPSSIVSDVVRARIDLTDADGYGRSGDVFASVGARTLEVSLDELELSSNGSESKWYAAFEPGWGLPRITLTAVPESSGAVLSIPSLPEGPGRIALLQTAAVVRQDDAVTLHAPEGFAGDFAAYATGWLQAIVSADDDAIGALQTVIPPGSTPRYANLGDEIAVSEGDAPLVVAVPAFEGSGNVRVACDADVTLMVTGFAKIELSVDGGDPAELGPGSVATPSSSCAGDADYVTWHIETTSLNGRGSDLVLRGGAP